MEDPVMEDKLQKIYDNIHELYLEAKDEDLLAQIWMIKLRLAKAIIHCRKE